MIDALGEEEGRVFCELYDITDRGNWEGKNILNMVGDDSDPRVADIAARGKCKLYGIRDKRVHPGRDEKILTAWNGWMLAAFADAAVAFDRDDYRETARRNAEFLLKRMNDGRIIRSGSIPGLLEDYSGAAWGLALAYEATHERRCLDASRELLEQILTRFADEENGGFFDTPVDHEKLITRPKDLFDNATPGANSVTCEVLLRLALLFDDKRYSDIATKTIDAIWSDAERYPSGFGFLLSAAEWREGQPKEIAITGDTNDAAFKALRKVVGEQFLPHRVLVAGKASSDLPLLENRPHDKVLAYVCVGYACLEPTNDPERLKLLLGPSA